MKFRAKQIVQGVRSDATEEGVYDHEDDSNYYVWTGPRGRKLTCLPKSVWERVREPR